MRKLLKRLVIVVSIIVCVLGALCLGSRLHRMQIRDKATRSFWLNAHAFNEAVTRYFEPGGSFKAIPADKMADVAADVDFQEVYISDQNMYFELGIANMGMCPYGVVWVTNSGAIPHFYQLEHITDRWFYFWMTS